MRRVGTVVRGIRAPVICKGDDLVKVVVDSVLGAAEEGGFGLSDRDVVAITESVVAISQGNYASADQIASAVRAGFGLCDRIGVVFPVLSRNRFSVVLRGIARAIKEVTLVLSHPADEVGNSLISSTGEGWDILSESASQMGFYSRDHFEKYYGTFARVGAHKWTGINYLDLYRDIVESEGSKVNFVFINSLMNRIDLFDKVLVASIHSRKRCKRILQEVCHYGKVLGLDDLLTQSVDGSGYCERYGLLGSNKMSEECVKLFPRACDDFLNQVRDEIYRRTGKSVGVMVYGDGAFKDPLSGVWELADPVVSPYYTVNLVGAPTELKLKYMAFNEYVGGRCSEELTDVVRSKIRNKDVEVGDMAVQGTTPRMYVDLLGTLCDLTSGSGDKGTPFILVQGYFDTYADN